MPSIYTILKTCIRFLILVSQRGTKCVSYYFSFLNTWWYFWGICINTAMLGLGCIFFVINTFTFHSVGCNYFYIVRVKTQQYIDYNEQAKEDGDKPGLEAMLQKVLQLYASNSLSKRSYAMKGLFIVGVSYTENLCRNR